MLKRDSQKYMVPNHDQIQHVVMGGASMTSLVGPSGYQLEDGLVFDLWTIITATIVMVATSNAA